MPDQLLFATEVVLNGLMAGVMYALVALGFVLIFKASGIFNYAQGVMALFAAMTLVGIQNGQVPFAHLINATFGTNVHYFGWKVPALPAIPMTVRGDGVLRLGGEPVHVLRHLVNQEPIILFMATIGLAYFLEGVADLMWGSDIKTLDVGLPQGTSTGWTPRPPSRSFGYGFFIDNLDIVATVIAALLVAGLVAVLAVHQAGPRPARGGRRPPGGAVGGHLAQLHLGAGVVDRGLRGAGGGHHVGREVGRAVLAVADRAQGAAGPDAGRVHLDPRGHRRRADHRGGREAVRVPIGAPFLGGATENWFAYVLALVFLVFRPQGLFGEKIIERV